MANLRISLGVEVRPGKEHAVAKGFPGLWQTLEQLPRQVMSGQYRDRADAENNYDELENQWGWNGFTSRKLKPCRLTANLVALFNNWWTLYLRFYDSEYHHEAIHSCPMLMASTDTFKIVREYVVEFYLLLLRQN